MQNHVYGAPQSSMDSVPFGVTYEKIGTIQRRLAWPLHKDDTLFRSGRPTGLNIYATLDNGVRFFWLRERITTYNGLRQAAF
ncbi:hypothetical protein BXZ70DRAFT_370443 [Cristinia sonorae]|uniref:Uncharacterized protein n=1 Tax=Cristinia sonorae TaxID=1940300 RepID=A0A8K0XMR4_9AGAR|nr:hypothetical protein BXZ70DRAFT_370443 [Cristinia sonorae]